MQIGRFHFSVHALIRFNQRCSDLDIAEQVQAVTIMGGQRAKVVAQRLSKRHRRTEAIMFITKDEAIFVCLRDKYRLLVVTVMRYLNERDVFLNAQVEHTLKKNKMTDDSELSLVKAVREREYSEALEACPIHKTLKMELSRAWDYMSDAELRELNADLVRLDREGKIVREESIVLYRELKTRVSFTLERRTSAPFDIKRLESALGASSYLFDQQFVYLRRALAARDFSNVRGVDSYDSARLLIHRCAARSVSTIESAEMGLIQSADLERTQTTLGNLARLLPQDADFFRSCQGRIQASKLRAIQRVYMEFAKTIESDWSEALPKFQPLVMPKVMEAKDEVKSQIESYSYLPRAIKLLNRGVKHPSSLMKLAKMLVRSHAGGSIDSTMFSFLLDRIYQAVSVGLEIYAPVVLPIAYRKISPDGMNIDLAIDQLSQTVGNIQSGLPIRLAGIESSIETVDAILAGWELSKSQLSRVLAVERVYRMLWSYCVSNEIDIVDVGVLSKS